MLVERSAVKRSAESVYCFQCCAFWCDDCITGHNIIRVNKEHRVLALKDFQGQDIEEVLRVSASKDRAKLEIDPKLKNLKLCQNKAYHMPD